MTLTVVGMAEGESAEDRRTVRSRAKYLAALERLVQSQPKHQRFKEGLRNGRGYSINPTNVALEAGMSRDPLYSRHTDVLAAIRGSERATNWKPKRDDLERSRNDRDLVNELRDEIVALKRDKARLATENFGLLARLSVANERIERLGRDKARLSKQITAVRGLRVLEEGESN